MMNQPTAACSSAEPSYAVVICLVKNFTKKFAEARLMLSMVNSRFPDLVVWGFRSKVGVAPWAKNGQPECDENFLSCDIRYSKDLSMLLTNLELLA